MTHDDLECPSGQPNCNCVVCMEMFYQWLRDRRAQVATRPGSAVLEEDASELPLILDEIERLAA